jgi:hypothetical protein
MMLDPVVLSLGMNRGCETKYLENITIISTQFGFQVNIILNSHK